MCKDFSYIRLLSCSFFSSSKLKCFIEFLAWRNFDLSLSQAVTIRAVLDGIDGDVFIWCSFCRCKRRPALGVGVWRADQETHQMIRGISNASVFVLLYLTISWWCWAGCFPFSDVYCGYSWDSETNFQQIPPTTYLSELVCQTFKAPEFWARILWGIVGISLI